MPLEAAKTRSRLWISGERSHPSRIFDVPVNRRRFRSGSAGWMSVSIGPALFTDNNSSDILFSIDVSPFCFFINLNMPYSFVLGISPTAFAETVSSPLYMALQILRVIYSEKPGGQ
jgi:hypothetical protein